MNQSHKTSDSSQKQIVDASITEQTNSNPVHNEVSKVDVGIAYTMKLLDKLRETDESQGVFNVSKEFLSRSRHHISEGIVACRKCYVTQEYSIAQWQEHITQLCQVLNEGWDTLSLKKELRALNKVMEQIRNLRAKAPEPVSRYVYFQKKRTPYQEALVAKEEILKGEQEGSSALSMQGKARFMTALKNSLALPYEGSQIKGVVSVIEVAAGINLDLSRELIEHIELDRPRCRDSAVLAALTQCDFSHMREAVALLQLLFSVDAKDRALQFLFDICFEQDTDMAIKLARKVVTAKLRYQLLAQLSARLCKTDLEQAQSVCHMISNMEIREKVHAMIEQYQWQNFLRKQSITLPESKEMLDSVQRKHLKG